MTATEIQTLAFVIGALAAVAALYFSRDEQRHRKRQNADKELFGKIDIRIHDALAEAGIKEFGDRMTRMETTLDIFTRAIALDAARALHSPHPEMKRRDYLLERLLGEDITPAEQGELYRMLYGSAFGPHTEGLPAGDRVAASLVLRLLESMDENERNQAERLHTLDQPTMTCVVTVGPDGRITSLSGDYEGVLGWTANQLAGVPVSVVVPLWGQLENDAAQRQLRVDVPLDIPHQREILDSAGRARPVWVTIRPIEDAGLSVSIETRDPDSILASSPLH